MAYTNKGLKELLHPTCKNGGYPLCKDKTPCEDCSMVAAQKTLDSNASKLAEEVLHCRTILACVLFHIEFLEQHKPWAISSDVIEEAKKYTADMRE